MNGTFIKVIKHYGTHVHRLAWRYLLTACLLSAGAAADTVTFLIAAGIVDPYQVVSDDPEHTLRSGILIDVLRQALSGTDIQLTFVERPYKRIRMDILANRHQNWISYGSPSWLDERVKALGVIPPSLLYLLLDKKMPADTRRQIDHALLHLQQQGEIEKILQGYQ